jgi:pimeloyl-ACP methyl ester carboxylesterase
MEIVITFLVTAALIVFIVLILAIALLDYIASVVILPATLLLSHLKTGKFSQAGNFPIVVDRNRNIVLDGHMTVFNAESDGTDDGIDGGIDDRIDGGRWVVLFNGSAGSRSHDKMIEVSAWLSSAMQVNVLHFDYRGVALSTGRATHWLDLVEDGLAAIDALCVNHKPKHITLFGFSLGGAICMKVGELRPDVVQHVMCDRSFLKVGDVVNNDPYYELLSKLTRWNVDVTSSWMWLHERGRVDAAFAVGDPVSENGGKPHIPNAKELALDTDTGFHIMNHQPFWKHNLQIFHFSNCRQIFGIV